MSNEKLAMRNDAKRSMSVNMRLLLLSLLLFGLCWNVSAQRRGGDNESGVVEIADARRSVTLSGKQWAVFIAINEYKEWEPLLYPVKDAQDIKKILLDNYYFDEVRELYNRDATAAAIRKLFIDLQDKAGPNDSVFVFHAGHGINEDRTKTPAWIPYDGGKAEDIYSQQNWLSHLQIRSMLDSLKARHVFLISDSCFSGDLLDSRRGAAGSLINYPAAYDRVSRQAMSSGASEQVEDVSEFASRLKNTLLRTETPYITPDTLLTQIKDVQTVRPLFTMPILAPIPGSGHQLGGSFLFFRKNPNLEQPAVEQPSAPAENPAVVKEPALPVPGETGYFVGSWIATVEYDNSFDTYQISLSENGTCKVILTNGEAEQETTGNWSYDEKNKTFKLNAVFRNAPIIHMRNIEWVSRTSFANGSNSFNILAKPANNARNNVRFVFFRDN